MGFLSGAARACACLSAAAVCAGAPRSPSSSPSAAAAAPFLTVADLQSTRRPPSTVQDAWLGPTADAVAPSNVLAGQLTLQDTSDVSYQVLVDTYQYSRYPTRQRLPPDSPFEYVQEAGGALVPLAPGLIVTDDLVFNLIMGVGRAWDEPGGADGGWSRASIPFALSERNANCVHNGLLLFAFKSDGATTRARFQITKETCKYFQVTYWGQLPLAFVPMPPRDADRYAAALARHRLEQEHVFPSAPLSQLAADYPGVDPAVFGAKLTQARVSQLGVVANGVSYVQGCSTRTGGYAGHCAQLVAPSYSTSKAIFAGLAMMRLAQLFGEGVYGELVRDWLPAEVSAARGNWDGVTFKHALDMQTGNYYSDAYQADEDQYMTSFFEYDTYAGKARESFDYQARRAPGTKHIYHTTDTFIVTAAMQKYAEVHVGPSADIWGMIVEDILVPLHVQSGAYTSLRTYGDVSMPYGGYGLWFVPDDVAKITHFILNSNGAIGGAQVLAREPLNAGMQRNPLQRGLDADKPGLTVRYQYGFWAQEYRGSAVGCPQVQTYYQPYFSGFGGIRMQLMGNGVTYYYFSDNGEYEVEAEMLEAAKIVSFCPPAAPAAPVAED